MRRRDFITVLAGATAWVAATGRAGEAPRGIGILGGASEKAGAPFAAAFVKGLKDTGFIEGQHVTIEYRWADGRYHLMPSFAAELLGRDVALLACFDAPLGSRGKGDNQNHPDCLRDRCRSG